MPKAWRSFENADKEQAAAALALVLAQKGWRNLAVDADPDGNLGAALGASPEELNRIVPIARQKELIEQQTGAKRGAKK